MCIFNSDYVICRLPSVSLECWTWGQELWVHSQALFWRSWPCKPQPQRPAADDCWSYIQPLGSKSTHRRQLGQPWSITIIIIAPDFALSRKPNIYLSSLISQLSTLIRIRGRMKNLFQYIVALLVYWVPFRKWTRSVYQQRSIGELNSKYSS